MILQHCFDIHSLQHVPVPYLREIRYVHLLKNSSNYNINFISTHKPKQSACNINPGVKARGYSLLLYSKYLNNPWVKKIYTHF